MKYEEIIEKLKSGKRISTSVITCTQMFMLLYDRVIRNIQYNDTLYELNLIPVDEPTTDTTITVNDELYPHYDDFEIIFKQIINLYTNNKQICINLDDEYFEMIIEVLETK